MRTRTRLAGMALASTLAVAAAGTLAQPAPAASAADATPATVAAPGEPKADENAAQRNRSQPGNNAPFWRVVRESGVQEGVVNLPGAERGVLIQRFVKYPGSRATNAGEAWREVRNRWIIPYGGALLLIIGIGLALFYWRRGPLGGHEPDTGRVIERFTPFERAAHWTNATAFVVLAVSGIVMAFGKFFLLPIIGGALFGWLTYALKTTHNFVGPLFTVSLVVVLVTFVKDNIANAADLDWLRKAGGLLGHKQVPSHRFNAMEKGLFWWVMLVPGVLVVLSGLMLDKLLPGLDYLRGDMQIAHMLHACGALLMMAGLAGHIYMGTVGVKDAYKAMRTGYVDEGWAREHHELWYDDVKAGKIPAQRSALPPPNPLVSPPAGA
jgi:formate dehydrogenase subunit gamma